MNSSHRPGTMWSGMKMIYGVLWKNERIIIVRQAAEIFFYVAVVFCMSVIPSVLIGILEKGSGMKEYMVTVLVLTGGSAAVRGARDYFATYGKFQYIAPRFEHFWLGAVKKIYRIPYRKWEQDEVQNLGARAMEGLSGNDVGMEGMCHTVTTLLSNCLGLLLYMVLLSGMNKGIALFLLGLALWQTHLHKKAMEYENSTRDEKGDIWRKTEYLNRQTYNTEAGKDIRLYGLHRWLTSFYGQLNCKLRKIFRQTERCYCRYEITGTLIQTGRDLLCYGYLIYRAANGMAVSEFVFYISMISGFAIWIAEVSNSLIQMGQMNLQFDEMRAFMNISEEQTCDGGEVKTGQSQAAEIIFEHVSFSYPGGGKKVLDDVSFRLPAGSRTALVGINGAGKTTIVKLICGFYQPTAGRILIDGEPLRVENAKRYMENTAVVLQKSLFIPATIAENVSCRLLKDTNIDLCRKVLKEAGLWEKVQSLKNQELTNLTKIFDSQGSELSGGEKQKLLLARALYRCAGICLLDEPTAALDAIAESQIYHTYMNTLSGLTLLFISHRLASTRFCDNILFLDQCKIIGQGTHDVLMQKCGGYREMFEAQSRYYQEDGHEEAE